MSKFGVVLVVLVAACGVHLESPNVAVTCAGASDCPSGLVCVSDSHLCVSPSTACVQNAAGTYTSAPDGNKCEASGIASGAGVCFSGACVLSACGDGTTEFGEECDDANQVDTDACRNNCKTNVCGDGVVNTGVEQCDDGNTADNDACLTTCVSNVCGDGIINVGVETCEDQNANENDGCGRCRLSAWTVVDQAGFGASRGDPKLTPFSTIQGVTRDPFGNVYVADVSNSVVWRYEPASGTVRIFAGTYQGDGVDPSAMTVAATQAKLQFPDDVATDRLGNIYIAQYAELIRVDGRSLMATRVLGDGSSLCFSASGCGDGGPAVAATTGTIAHVGLDDAGNIYVLDADAQRVRYIDTNGVVRAGFSMMGMHAMAVTHDGHVYVSATSTNLETISVWHIGASPTQYAGGAVCLGKSGTCGDGGGVANARFASVLWMTFSADGNTLYINDSDNHRVRAVTNGIITNVLGTGDACAAPACSADQQRDSAQFSLLTGFVVDPNGGFYGADAGLHALRATQLAGANNPYVTIAGNPKQNPVFNGTAADATDLDTTSNYIAVTPDGNVHVGQNNALIHVDVLGNVNVDAELDVDTGMGATADNGVVVFDEVSGGIFKVAADATTTQLAGNGSRCTTAPYNCGDGGRAADASFKGVLDVAAAADGTVYVSDRAAARIRRISNGVVDTVIGNGTACSSACGDGGLASAAQVAALWDLTVAGNGDLYFIDDLSIRRVEKASGLVTTVVSDAATTTLHGLVATGDSPISLYYLADGVLHRYDGSDHVLSCTGDSCNAYLGDMISAFSFADYNDVALAPDGTTFYFSSSSDKRVAKVDGSGFVGIFVGPDDTPGAGLFDAGKLDGPGQIVPGLSAGVYWVADHGRVHAVDLGTRQISAVVGTSDHLADISTTTARYYQYQPFDGTGIPFLDVTGITWEPGNAAFWFSDTSRRAIFRVTLGASTDPRTWPVTEVITPDSTTYREGAVANARFGAPSGLAYDATNQTLYVADAANHVIRSIQGGMVATAVGHPQKSGFDLDLPAGVQALDAYLDGPTGLLLDGHGGMFIADTGNGQIKHWDIASGVVSVVLGNGTISDGGDGTPARALPIAKPREMALDSFGNLFVTAGATLRVVVAGDDGSVTGDDPMHVIYGAGARLTYPESATSCLSGLHVLPGDDQVLVVDQCTGIMLRLQRN